MEPRLTPHQQRFLDYLRQKISREGQAPSLRSAAGDLGVSHAAVAQMLKTLEAKGCLRREGRYSRVLHLLNPLGQTAGLQRGREIPIIGRITAGLPIYAQQEWAGTLLVDGRHFRGANLFALHVQGDSMETAGIRDRDIAICEPRQYARNGEIVAALIRGEEATVKRFYLHRAHIELRPANPRYRPMTYGFDEVLVQGKVIGIQRGPEGIDGVAPPAL
ncbi:MAG: transcriptional repressor LexA [Desulfobacterales bacterium]|jgi:repressor LexA